MDSLKQIDIQQALVLIGSNEVTVVDIRDEGSYQQAHIDGAVLLSDHNVREFLNTADRNKPLICYCYHGFSSQNAAGFLMEQGFKDVYSLIGGFEEWRRVHKE
jgi:thiosulfate sulfurtransferase